MKTTILTAAFLAATAFGMNAQSEIMNITFNNGNVQSFNVSEISEISFEDSTPSITEGYTGQFEGTIELTVGGAFTYQADMTVTVTAGEDGSTIDIHYPQYSLAGTMMGDLTLGELTIADLQYDESRNGFYRSYGGEGLTQHFKAEKDGTVTMDADYPLNDPSTILVTLSDDGTLSIENPFKLGAMPLPLTSKFTGTRK